MADVRALLAAERQSRRISHPHLTYSKNGALNCNVCNLNIKSEQLWPGHLKSLNHRKNVQKIPVEPVRPQKRKLESVEVNDDDERNYEVDSRKKPKPAEPAEQQTIQPTVDEINTPGPVPAEPPIPAIVTESATASHEQGSTMSKPPENVDEDEWAAFEREVAPLANQDYTAATIEAAPVSAAEIAVQQKTNTLQQREEEAEAEKEDESRRMEEEFEVMEEMEDRVRRLRARREALRQQGPSSDPQPVSLTNSNEQENPINQEINTSNDTSSDEDDIDGWYD